MGDSTAAGGCSVLAAGGQHSATPLPARLSLLVALAAAACALRLSACADKQLLTLLLLLQVQPHLGSLVLCPGQGLDVTWLPQDRLLVLVLEMLAAPTAAADAADADGAAAAVGTVLVGRSVLAPFTAISADGGVAALAEGRHRLCFDSSSCMGSFNSSSCWAPKGCSTSMLASSSGAGEAGDLLLPLNWRAMLADTATRSVPDPAVQLDLQPCSRMGAEQPETAAKLAAAATAAAPVAAAAAASVAATSGKKASAVVVHAAAQTALPAAHSPAVSVEVVRPAAPPVAPAPVAEQVHQPVPEVYESPAARSLKLAAQHLEQAANIPVQVCTRCPGCQPSCRQGHVAASAQGLHALHVECQGLTECR